MAMSYWVRVNIPTKTVIIHKSSCRYGDCHPNVNHEKNWWTRFDSLDNARNYAKSKAINWEKEPASGKCCNPLE